MKKILTYLLIFLFLISSNIYLVSCQNTIPFLDGFDYRKSFYLESNTSINIISKIIVFNQTGTDTNKNIYNYNLNQPDFDDIRVTTNDGLTLVGAYSNIINEQENIIIWLRIPFANQTYYLYFGNDTANNYWSSENVFNGVLDNCVLASYLDDNVNDETGNNDGSFVGSGSYYNDFIYNKGAYHIGSGWVDFPDNDLYDFSSEFSAVFWVNWTSGLTYPIQRNTASSGWWLEITPSGATQSFIYPNASSYGLGYYVYKDSGDITFSGITYKSGEKYAIWQNNSIIASRIDISGNINNAGLTALASGAGGVSGIDNLMLFRDLLTNEEMSLLYINYPYIDDENVYLYSYNDEPIINDWLFESNIATYDDATLIAILAIVITLCGITFYISDHR